MHKRTTIWAYVFSFIVSCGCEKSRNYPEAHYRKVDAGYAVTLSGRRKLMAHDPISALKAKTYDVSDTFVLPRISGRIEGSEIPHKPTQYGLNGYIEISGTNMDVNLLVDNTDDRRQDPVSWNGKYTLVKQ